MPKVYQLADSNYRNEVDLQIYTTEITEAVHKVKPTARVTVLKNGYYVDQRMTKTEAIKISQELRAGVLKKYTMYRPCLFNGCEVKNNKLHPEHKEGGRKCRRTKM